MTDFNNPFSLLKAKPNNIDDPIINISPNLCKHIS